MISYGANPSGTGIPEERSSPLNGAIYNYDFPLVKVLLESGAKQQPDFTGLTPLGMAVEAGKSEIDNR